MALVNIYANGIGGSTGDSLAQASPLYTPGNVWYVSSLTGSDSTTPRGLDRTRPLATVGQAYTNAGAGDIIVCLAGHSETLTSAQVLAKAGTIIIGEGAGANMPVFTRNAASDYLFDVTSAAEFRNIRFAASLQTTSYFKVRCGARTRFRGCRFECGAYDTANAIEFITGSNTSEISDTVFVSTATSVAAQPGYAININYAVQDLQLTRVTLDGGTTGWSNQYALNGAAAPVRLAADDIDLLNDSDILLPTGTTGRVTLRLKSGSARVCWTP
jgi:hypothetical protein